MYSFGPNLSSHGKTTPKQAVISLHMQQPEVPHTHIQQVQNALKYDRRKAVGAGNNIDHIVAHEMRI